MSKAVEKRSLNCLNCGHELGSEDNFCPNCGQNNYTHKLTVSTILGDFISDYFSFDSKLFQSLSPLMIKPGYLTKEFCSGKRIKYIHPVRLYLFISFLSFFLFSFDMESGKQLFHSDDDDLGISFKVAEDEIKYDSAQQFRNIVERKGIDHYLDSLGVDDKFEKLMVTQIYRLSKSDSKSISQYFTKNASIMMFFLMPVFAALLMLFFRKSGYYYVEHLMHSLHIHSFIFLLFGLFALLSQFFEIDYSILIILILVTGYTIKSLRNVYEQKRGKTIWKFLGVITIYNVVIFAGFLITVLISLALF